MRCSSHSHHANRYITHKIPFLRADTPRIVLQGADRHQVLSTAQLFEMAAASVVGTAAIKAKSGSTKVVKPEDDFEPEMHFYPRYVPHAAHSIEGVLGVVAAASSQNHTPAPRTCRVLNASIHPLVATFFNMKPVSSHICH